MDVIDGDFEEIGVGLVATVARREEDFKVVAYDTENTDIQRVEVDDGLM